MPAPLFNRLIAYMIDWYISTCLISLAISIVQSVVNNELVITNSIERLNSIQAIFALIIGVCFVMIYYCYPLFLKKYDGQTIGKHIMGLKVVRYDYQSLTLKDYFMRYLIGLIVIEENLNTCSFVFRSTLSLLCPHIFVEIIYDVGIILCIISIILVFTKKHKMIHDLISKTQVIRITNS